MCQFYMSEGSAGPYVLRACPARRNRMAKTSSWEPQQRESQPVEVHMKAAQEFERRSARLVWKHSSVHLVSSRSESCMLGHLAPCTELQTSVSAVLCMLELPETRPAALSCPLSVDMTGS